MTTTLTANDVKTDCPVWFQGKTRDKSKCVQKKVYDLGYDLRQLGAKNKQLKVELNCSKKKFRHLRKDNIRTYNEWTFNKANFQQECHVSTLQVFEGGMAGLQPK